MLICSAACMRWCVRLIDEKSAGGVVFRHKENQVEIVLIKDRYERWTLPKGKLEPGEDSERAALREIAEETGIAGELVSRLHSIKYAYSDQLRGLVNKTVDYFLVKALNEGLIPQPGEVLAVRWVELSRAIRECDYENTLDVLTRAAQSLRPL